jgi:hypothetical protein
VSDLKPQIRGGSAAWLPWFYLWLLNGEQRMNSAAADRPALLTQVELLDQVFIPVGVRLAEVIEQAPSHCHHFEEAAARGMIFGVTLQMFRKLRDPLSEECDLHIRASGIFFVELELLHIHRVTAFCHKRSATVNEVHRIASRAGLGINRREWHAQMDAELFVRAASGGRLIRR